MGRSKRPNPLEKKPRRPGVALKDFFTPKPVRRLTQRFIKIYNESGEQVVTPVPVKFDFKNGAWRSLFFQTLVEQNGHIGETCKKLKVSRVYLYRTRRDDPEFEKEFIQYMDAAVDVAEDELKRRGIEGVKKGVYYQGRRRAYETEYSDTCLTRYLAAHRAAYRTSGLEVGGKEGGPVPVKLDHDVSERLLSDPTFNKLAHALLEHLTSDPGGNGEPPVEEKVGPDTPPDQAE